MNDKVVVQAKRFCVNRFIQKSEKCHEGNVGYVKRHFLNMVKKKNRIGKSPTLPTNCNQIEETVFS